MVAGLFRPGGNDQIWQVDTGFGTTYCVATINFNVPGKPCQLPSESRIEAT